MEVGSNLVLEILRLTSLGSTTARLGRVLLKLHSVDWVQVSKVSIRYKAVLYSG